MTDNASPIRRAPRCNPAVIGHGTNIGKVRRINEDAYALDEELGLFLVADGMGGHAAGDVASRLTVEHVLQAVQQGEPLAEAIASAHQVVLDAGDQGIGDPNMGTTVVALQLHGHEFEVAWVGDSRAYLWDGRHLTQLTHDHSTVQELVDLGYLSREDARIHPYSGLLTRSIGIARSERVEVDHVTGLLHREDQILLCSDGLTTELPDAAIAELLAAPGSPQEKVDLLIQVALEVGGNDNITALLVSAPDSAPGQPSLF